MTISMTRDALLARLADRLAAAKAEDAKVKKSHEAEERAALKTFRLAVRAALKWDWPTVKANRYRPIMEKVPACPRLNAAEIEGCINAVKFDTRKRPFAVKPGTDLFRAVNWTPPATRKPTTVCD